MTCGIIKGCLGDDISKDDASLSNTRWFIVSRGTSPRVGIHLAEGDLDRLRRLPRAGSHLVGYLTWAQSQLGSKVNNQSDQAHY